MSSHVIDHMTCALLNALFCRYQQILAYHMEHNDVAQVMNTCKKFRLVDVCHGLHVHGCAAYHY